MKRKYLIVILCLVCLGVGTVFGRYWFSYLDYKHMIEYDKYIPKNVSEGCVPNAETAIKIAEAIWSSKYGNVPDDLKPYDIRLKNEVWTINTSGPQGHTGSLTIEISSKDAKVIREFRSK